MEDDERQLGAAPWLEPLWVHWRTLLSWPAGPPAAAVAPLRRRELEPRCPELAAPAGGAARVAEAARRAAAAASCGDEARRAAAEHLALRNGQWCEQWRLVAGTAPPVPAD